MTITSSLHLILGWSSKLVAEFQSLHWMSVSIYILSVYTVVYMLYNLYFHPLAKFPGPFLARASLLWRIKSSLGGRLHRKIEKQHQKYGPVFRVSPNELSFASVPSWKDIYGPWPGKEPFPKSEFYDMYGAGFSTPCVGSERDPKEHSRKKRSLASSFTKKALSEQETIVQRCVNSFITKIGEEGKEEKGLNMTDWCDMVSFDILGEMAFGESFGCVESCHPHHWQQLIAKHLFFITVVDNIRRYPFLRQIGQFILPKITISTLEEHSSYSRQKVAKRLNSSSSRKDFLTNIAEKVKAGEIQQEELTAHASTLIIAGGETVATFLVSVTHYLCTNPSTLSALQREVRSNFKSYSKITAATAQQLPYLQAVISEGLRIYPPGSQGFPRTSPGAMIDGVYVPVGTEVYTSAWTVTHDPANFERPADFLPDRWLDPMSRDVKEASQPFSLGPRGCLGRNFAYMEMSIILAKIHYMYDLEAVDPGLDWEGNSHCHVMWWKPDLWIRFIQRRGGSTE